MRNKDEMASPVGFLGLGIMGSRMAKVLQNVCDHFSFFQWSIQVCLVCVQHTLARFFLMISLPIHAERPAGDGLESLPWKG